MIREGSVLGKRYELQQQIGSGGMSVVYKALDRKLNRIVAVKVMREDFIDDPVQIEKFHKEALAIAVLSHPNIVGVYDTGNEEGMEYMVKEYVDGITLKEYIRRRRQMESSEIVKVTLKIAEGLKVAHEHGIIHRDIKPQNIMVTPKGEVKVTDFGIAKFVTASTITDHGQAMGSVHYISPEQARGEQVDIRSDLYSLGITMYEMAMSHPPFDGETPVAVAMKQISDPLPSIAGEENGIWPGLETIIVGLTRKKPDDRYQNCSELIWDLKMVYKDESHGAGAVIRKKKKTDHSELSNPEFEPVNPEFEKEPVEEAPIPVSPARRQTGPLSTAGNRTDHGATRVGYYQVHGDYPGVKQPQNDSRFDTKSRNSKKNTGEFTPYTGPGSSYQTESVRKKKQKNEPSGKKQKKSSGGMGLLLVLLGVLLTALVFVVVRAITTVDNSQNATYAMPSFTGMTLEEVQKKVQENRYNLSFEKEYILVYDDTAEAGKVVGQTPEAGMSLKAGERNRVQLTLSKGPKPINMLDNYIGSLYEEVILQLESKGIPYQISILETDEESQHGLVVGQYPMANETISGSEEVTLTVAYSRSKIAVVPRLVGLTEVQAGKALKDQNLELGRVIEAYHPQVEEGKVITQSLASSERVPQGSRVSVTISMGPYEGSETQVEGAYLINEELLGTVKGSVNVYAWAVVNGREEELLNQHYSREDIIRSNLYLKYYKGTTEIHVSVNGEEVFSQIIQ